MMLSLLADLDGFAVPGSESSELSESLACGSGNSVRNFSSSIPKEGGSHSSRPSRMQLVPSMGLMPGHVFENYPLGLEAAINEEFAIRDGGLWNVLKQISIELQNFQDEASQNDASDCSARIRARLAEVPHYRV